MIINIITFNNIFVNTTISTSISSLATLLSSLVNLHQESSKTLCSIIFLSTSKASSILVSKMMIIITIIKSHLFNPSSSHKLKHYAALFFIWCHQKHHHHQHHQNTFNPSSSCKFIGVSICCSAHLFPTTVQLPVVHCSFCSDVWTRGRFVVCQALVCMWTCTEFIHMYMYNYIIYKKLIMQASII